MRSHLSLKSNICPEGAYVYGAGMSVEVSAHYPGRSDNVSLKTTRIVSCEEALSEVSRGHGRAVDPSEGPNIGTTMGT